MALAILNKGGVGVPDPIPNLGATVRRFREARGLSQNALAAAAGLDQGHLSAIEAGKRPNPTANVLLALARALGVTVDELLRDPVEAGE